MFAKYDEILISKDQIHKITNWLSQWDLDDKVIAHDATRSSTLVSRTRVDSIDSKMSQSDISNWLKSWGQNMPTSKQHTKHNTLMTTVSSQESTTIGYSELK
jgi:hypothetical protein